MTGELPSNRLAELLAQRIAQHGPLTFAEYMEACLYHPEYGYYTRAGQGQAADGSQRAPRDFYTSVDVHPIFGRLLARQFAEMWRYLGQPPEFTLAECGAGSGQLARQVLDFSARALPHFYAAIRYTGIERSQARRALHADRLKAHAAAGKFTSGEELPRHIVAGCVFSNEFVDALPVHRVAMVDGSLREIYVEAAQGHMKDLVGELSTPRLHAYFEEQGITLPEGARAEACLAACDWIEQAGRALERGFVLTVDYGHEARELYNERHMSGTLLAYHQHRASEHFYARPGEQDLTAHVNFTALEKWGHRAGLRRLGLASQTQFLMALGRGNDFADLYEEGMAEVDRTRARLKLKSLIYPEGMGETFYVLVQAKRCTMVELTGLQAL